MNIVIAPATLQYKKKQHSAFASFPGTYIYIYVYKRTICCFIGYQLRKSRFLF